MVRSENRDRRAAGRDRARGIEIGGSDHATPPPIAAAPLRGKARRVSIETLAADAARSIEADQGTAAPRG
jgi:hypothetical protein